MTASPLHSPDPLERALALVEHFATESETRAKHCRHLAQRAPDHERQRQHVHEAEHRRADARALRALVATVGTLSRQLVEARRVRWWHRPAHHARALVSRFRR